MSRMQFCRFCLGMKRIEGGLWCNARQAAFGAVEASEPNDCPHYAYCPRDALGATSYRALCAHHRRRARESALYARRMAGDWS